MVKWVRCRVTDANAFDRGQRAWQELRELPGFFGQTGGWSRREPGVAHIFAWWARPRDHQAFLAGAHDRLASAQQGTYDAIEVRLLQCCLDIGKPFPLHFADGAVARLTHGDVKATRQKHFTWAQANVWNPGMATAPGMLGGVFAQDGATGFLVLTLWKTAADHQHYVRDRFPELRQCAAVADDLNAGDLIDLNLTWTLPGRP